MDFDFDASFFIIVIFSISIILSFFKAIILYKPNHGPNPNPNLLPGPRKLPLIGNLHQLRINCELPHRKLSELASKYGAMMHLQLGEISTVVVSSAEAAKEVLHKHDVAFANRSTLIAGGIIYYNNTEMGFSPYGDYWRQLRKICTTELLSTRRVRSFKGLRQHELSSMCKWIASKEGTIINLSEKLEFTICDLVTKAALGNNVEELATFVSVANETAKLISGFHIADFYPSSKLLQLVSKVKSRAERLHKIADRILQTVIDEHMQDNDESKQQEDLVDVLLKFNKSGHGFHLTVENIKAILMDIFTAGIETSSTTINWAIAEILKHPRVLKKVQDEVRRVFGDKGFVDESSFEELKYLKSVIKETLRLHPPIPLLLPRVNTERCEIQGYEIPLSTRVIVNVSAIGRDPRYWNESNSFIPERYLDGNNSIDFFAKNFNYIPFGGGRRICPGISFGVANVEVPLAMLLYHFDWVLPDGIEPETLDMTEMHGVSVTRKNPLCVIPITKVSVPL